MASLALQAQLNRIEELSQNVLEVATTILNEILGDQRNDVAEIVHELRKAMRTARHIREVTEPVWARIEKQKFPVDLRRLTGNARGRLQKQLVALKLSASAKDRIKWFGENSREVVQDVVVLSQAFVGLVLYESMQLSYESWKYAGGQLEDARIAHDLEQARRDLADMRDTLAPLITELWRQFSLMIECPGASSWRNWDKKRARAEAVSNASQLRDMLANIYRGVTGVEFTDPGVQEELDPEVASLRWLFRPGARVYLCRDFVPLSLRERILIITDHRLFILRKGRFVKTGMVEEVRENAQVEYKFTESPGKKYICVYDRGAREGAKPIHKVRFKTEDFPVTEVLALATALYGARDDQTAGLEPKVIRLER